MPIYEYHKVGHFNFVLKAGKQIGKEPIVIIYLSLIKQIMPVIYFSQGPIP